MEESFKKQPNPLLRIDELTHPSTQKTGEQTLA